MLELFGIILGSIISFIGGIIDLKTGFIPEKLSNVLFLSSISFLLILEILLPNGLIVESFVWFFVFLIIGHIFSSLNLFGGGDVMMVSSLVLVLGSIPYILSLNIVFNIYISFLINLLVLLIPYTLGSYFLKKTNRVGIVIFASFVATITYGNLLFFLF